MGTASSATAPERCEEKSRLEHDFQTAEELFVTALATIRQRVGRSPKDEYVSLDRSGDQAWDRLERARNALDSHVRQHGCGSAAVPPASDKPIW